MSENKNQKEKIIVVGDLFIDENWLMAKTDNYHSTDVGEKHYNSLIKGPDSFVLSVCGIANVLKVLSGDSPEKSIHKNYDVVGVGTWNPKDTNILECILCSEDKIKNFTTPYTLTNNLQESYHSICKREDKKCTHECLDYKLINLIPDTYKEKVSTNRIYRIYEGFGSDLPKLKYRFDWQIDLNEKFIDYSKINEIENVNYIIIVDHGKGVITDKLVNELAIKYPKAKWYVRTKLKQPKWMEVLKREGISLRLLVVDEQLVDYTFGVRNWIQGTTLCRASLELLGEMLGLNIYDHGEPKYKSKIKTENTAILFRNNSAISGCSNKKDNARINYYTGETNEKMAIRVGRTSIFFNSLVYYDLMIGEGLNEKSLPIATMCAVNNVKRWMQECTQAWIDEKPSGLSGPFKEVVSWLKPEEIKLEDIPSQDYNMSWKEWNSSSKRMGILTYYKDEKSEKNLVTDENLTVNNYVKEFQVWRSYGILKNYICPGGEKRSAINNLVKLLKEYCSNGNPSIPYNCLFISEPGWGKSHLANCIANYFNLDFLNYSIAQMSTTRELIDSFKEIASTQKRSNKRILVFVDEIDAKIDGDTALGLLLSPMWEGKFKSEGYTNKIDPCIWIFAATKSLDEIRELSKGRDFLSRINGPTINLDFLNDKNREDLHVKGLSETNRIDKLKDLLISSSLNSIDDKRTEIVYQTVHMLKEQYLGLYPT